MDYEGDLALGIVEEAFNALCHHHSVLRARVERDDGGYLLHVPPGHVPEICNLSGTGQTLRQSIIHRPHYSSSLARLLVVRGDGSGQLALQLNHAVFDSQAAMYLLNEFWKSYTSIRNGEDISRLTPEALPASPSKYMTAFWDDTDLRVQDTMSADRAGDPSKLDREDFNSLPHEFRIRFSEQETRFLLHVCKEENASLHAVVSGALVLAFRNYRAHEDRSSRRNITCYSLVDVRNKLVPPLAPTETALVFFRSRADVSVGLEDPAITIGKKIKNQLDNDIARRLSSTSERPTLRRPQTLSHLNQQNMKESQSLAVNNGGAIPPFRLPNDLNIADLKFIPDVTVNPLLSKEPWPSFTVYSYNQRLTIDGRFSSLSFSVNDVASIRGFFRRALPI
ncbi:hypothetical protein HFP15_19205 [Amycolatopsis sp. K13G38]|uniref:Phthiocerol/phthiodiolone dimycocerosyl transferase n=1 Tax=Amycolatopsis acididurans TaxID=2724524 RepID=A0ABX1J7Z7_9PSEU|nr:hypothetical protein [Amycolatopsis acididurans]NKQ55014.1 hypothetical protein [Amycolatopsis acididurans]